MTSPGNGEMTGRAQIASVRRTDLDFFAALLDC